MSTSTETFQISLDQAETYEARFVPALFADWASALVDAAEPQPGQALLDVACGTGIVARTAAPRVAPTGKVTGVDINDGMLTVARRVRPDLEWRNGDAAALPFADSTFDVVLCQAALMFLPDATAALREMYRVSRPGGLVGVQVFAGLQDQPAYGPWIDVVTRHAGPDALKLLSTYWVHGDIDRLKGRFQEAGLIVRKVHTRQAHTPWPSVEEFVRTEIRSTPLIDRITDAVEDRIIHDSAAVLAGFAGGEGLRVPLVGHLVLARRP